MPRRKKKKPRTPKRRPRSTATREWIGGLIRTPFYIHDRETPYRAEAVFWLESPSGVIVAANTPSPEETAGAVGEALQSALDQPMAGPPRRPDRIRVASDTLAREVRTVIGDTIPITVAPTPELKRIVDSLAESMEDDDQEDLVEDTYLREGAIQPATVAAMFQSAATLFRLAPWKVATDDQVIRLDIPALGVEGACMSIIGHLGESLGLMIFPSLDAYEAFYEAAVAGEVAFEEHDLGSGWLVLNYDRGADLPDGMRQEVADHGWPVAAADAYPTVMRIDQDIVRAPHSERDMKIAAATASALSEFWVKHQRMFSVKKPKPVSVSYCDEDDLEVRLGVPYYAFDDFEMSTNPATTVDPIEETPEARLADKLMKFAAGRFGKKWFRFTRLFADLDEALQLAIPWSLFDLEIDGATVLDWYLEQHGGRLSAPEREIAEAQQNAWLSVWEVTAVEPGVSLTLTDLLSGETRQVQETTASLVLVLNDAILARLTDHDDVTLLSGLHPHPLPPTEAAEIVRLARGRLRRKRAVPVERLRDSKFNTYLIRKWEKHVAILDECPSVLARFTNTDDDPLLLTVDHFLFDPGAEAEIVAKLERLDGVAPPDPAADSHEFTFFRPGDIPQGQMGHTLLGLCRLEGGKLRLETNSINRADDLRARLETACGELIRHRLREHTDPQSSKFADAAAAGATAEPREPMAEMRDLELEFKRRHYETWPDHPLPALGGSTPRAAAKTAEGRRALDVLLKSMENMEQRGMGKNTFDFSPLRKDLGLD